VRSAIAHLDRVAIETLPLSDELRSRARIILDLCGRPADVLEKTCQFDLDTPQTEALNHLKSLISLLEQFSRAVG